MLTRLAKQHVRKGMFVEAVECQSRAFNNRRFVIETDELLQEILDSPAEYVLINELLGVEACQLRREELAGPTSRVAEPLPELVKEEVRRFEHSLHRSFSEASNGRIALSELGQLTEELRLVVDEAPDTFFYVTRLQSLDRATYQHSVAVSGFMMKLGEVLKLDDDNIRQLGIAGLVHDVGKLTIPIDILTKNGPLTAIERRLIQTHPEKGYRILRRLGSVSPTVLEIVRHHHELLDGSGYPHGLTGREISLAVRISTVCDVFDALTSVRPYKRAWEKTEAIRWLFERPHQFDTKLVLKIGDFL